MATAKYTNLASGTLTVGVNTSDTSLVLDTGEGALFPSAGDFWVVLAEGSTREICKCTSRSSDTLTVTRNQGGTNSSFTTAATVTHVITSQMIDQVRSDQVQTGANSSRPSAEKDGILYLPSDGVNLFRDTGAAWGSWGPLWKLTPPVDGDFSWVNQGSATKTTGNGYVAIADTDAGGDQLRMRVKSAPSTPYTITLGFLPTFAGGGSFGYSAGMCVRQSSDGKVIVCGSAYLQTTTPNGDYFVNQDFTAHNNFSANNQLIPGACAMWRGICWVRYIDNGTNRIWQVSADGLTWVDSFTEGRTTFLTADQVGFFVDPVDSNAAITVVHWSES